VDELMQSIEAAAAALRAEPADGLAQARARGVLGQAREAWGALDADGRASLGGPAGALRALLDEAPPPALPDEGDWLEEPEGLEVVELGGLDVASPVVVDPEPGGEPPSPEELLGRLGLSGFRPGQRDAVAAALAGRDSLVVMPTGGGKSLCYQLPALADRGLVVVISPLIALMADQLRRMREGGVRAAMLASGMSEEAYRGALDQIRSGEAQLVLAAPERFASAAFRGALARRRVALFVVDEAHCVTEWGHDFRPDYLRLHHAIADLGRPPVMACTATATPRVAREIAERLGLRDPVSVRSGFDRPNLAFDVFAVEGKGAMARKRGALLHRLRSEGGLPAIVYCGTRKDTEAVGEFLRARGLKAVVYHAGLPADVRRRAQESFMEGRAEVVVATNAFGMGVDKADVRTVAHWAIPTSLEAYYQEAGRAGRDGRPAEALLLAARYDLGRLIRFNTERTTTVTEVQRYVERLSRSASGGVLETDPPGDDDRVLLSIAERAGACVLEPAGRGRMRVTLSGRFDGSAASGALRVARDRGWEAYRAIERFMTSGECRRRQLLDHFGDSSPGSATGRCCDVCDPDVSLALAAVEVSATARPRAQQSMEVAAGPPVDDGELSRLKAWRMARAEGKPAYTVATNAALEEVLRRRPSDESGLLAIRGIGKAFCTKHGASLLEELERL
jgi:RecQ family ATP-dependent DNA helicase